MAYTDDTLVKIGGQNQAQSIYGYSTGDDLPTVTAAGYFSSAFGKLREDDYIFVRNTDEDYLLRISTASGGVVTASLLTYLSGAAQTSGWVQITDNTYTSGSPFALSGLTRTKLDVNTDSTIETYAPFGTTASTFWDDATSKLYGENVGDAFELRLQATAQPAQQNTYMTVEIDIGGSQGIIWADTRSFIKGTSAQRIVRDISYYTLSTFQANGGEIYLESNNNVDIYDITLFIRRVHRGG